jgi:K+ potassium transporter integral membrane domain
VIICSKVVLGLKLHACLTQTDTACCGSALYADMGHVGPTAIRRAWFGLVLPALLAHIIEAPPGGRSPLAKKQGQPRGTGRKVRDLLARVYRKAQFCASMIRRPRSWLT